MELHGVLEESISIDGSTLTGIVLLATDFPVEDCALGDFVESLEAEGKFLPLCLAIVNSGLAWEIP
ncbi:MAG: hypothetical protein K8T20_00825 [Planctomycetes bacterium]|nr:hypothetical protein [Planctomycetota bacterium]